MCLEEVFDSEVPARGGPFKKSPVVLASAALIRSVDEEEKGRMKVMF